MANYFSYFPKILYDAVGKGDYKVVTNLLNRVVMKKGLKEIAAVFDTIDVEGEMTPEAVAEEFYGNQNYYWIVLLFNNIKDRFYDWPLPRVNFETFVNDKYTNPGATHHYEILQTSGRTTSFDDSHMVEVNSTASGATAVTNYEYEERLQQAKGRIRLLKPEYIELVVEEFTTLMGN